VPSGPTLDIMVAEKIHRQVRTGDCGLNYGPCPGVWRPCVANLGGCLPGYSTGWDEACTVVEPVVRAGYISRQTFLAALRQQVRTVQRHGIDWPDLLFFLKPDMLCRAALIALKGPTHEAPPPPVGKPA
jgi:hypothetical protein